MWLGAIRFGDEWVNIGKAGKREKLVYANWAPGEPNGRNNYEECIALGTIQNLFVNQWNDVPCNDDKNIKGYMCEKSA